jgi:hypothetical protein
MTPYEMLDELELAAARFRADIPESVKQAAHINGLTEDDFRLIVGRPEFARRFTDAVLAGFLNRLAAEKGCHYTVRVEHLKRRTQRAGGGT